MGGVLHCITCCLLIRSMVTRHFRGAQELRPISQRQHYDFNFQAFEPVPPDTAMVAPGDLLSTRCTYDSSPRTNTTRYGEDSQDEMCYNFLMYYPR
jgi:hypothetical protein